MGDGGDAGTEPTDEPSPWWRSTRLVKRTFYVVAFFLVFNHLVLPQLGGARDAAHQLSQVNPVLLVLGLALELAALASYSAFTRATLPPEPRIPFGTLFRIQLSTKAVTNVVPGGSAAGSTLGYKLLTDAGVPSSAAGFSLATVGLGSAVVLNLLLWLALILSIPFSAGYNPLYVTAAAVGAILLGLLAALVLTLRRGTDRAEQVLRSVARRLPFVKEDTAARVIHDLAGRLAELLRQPELIRRSILWALANWLLDAASLWVFLRAFGESTNVVGLLVAFCLANVLAAIPITPGGLGVIEGVLIPTLVAFGVPRGTAAIGVISYRTASYWLPIPLGALAYGSLKFGPMSLGRLRQAHAFRALLEDSAPGANRHLWDETGSAPGPGSGSAGPGSAPGA